MKKLISTTCALAAAAALAAPAVPAAAKGGATEQCGPPGQIMREVAKQPGSTRAAFDGPPGAFVSSFCAPGHQDDGSGE